MDVAGYPRDVLAACAAKWPVIPHGVAASVGTGRGDAYAAKLGELVSRLDPPFFSDHLCYSSIGGSELFDLLPLPFTHEAADAAIAHARALQERVGKPLVLENITYYATMPGAEMSEAEFLTRVLQGADVGLLLDINNLYINAKNHGSDPRAFLEKLPLDRVRQIHLAGHTIDEDIYLDTHSRPVADPVWALFREVISRIGPVPTLIEWDQQIPSLDAVLDEADRAREVLDQAKSAA